MKSETAEILLFKECKVITYYTVRRSNEPDDEFTNFLNHHQNLKFINSLIPWLEEIGDIGAKPQFFRDEAIYSNMKGCSVALPPNKDSNISIPNFNHQYRLYCIRISNEIVFLLNGGLKTADKAQDCPNVREHFFRMNRIAFTLKEDIKYKSIQIQNSTLLFAHNYSLTYQI